MAGLTSAINAEERTRGIRACSIFPGDIDTPILDKRPAPPDAAARAKMMQPEDIAECALLAINLPPRVIIEEMIVRPALISIIRPMNATQLLGALILFAGPILAQQPAKSGAAPVARASSLPRNACSSFQSRTMRRSARSGSR